MKKDHQSTLISLKKAKSSLEKIINMLEKDEYCIKIVQQNLAVIWLLKSANLQLLEWHLSCCFVDAVKSNNAKKQADIVQEVLMIVKTAQNK